MSGWQFVCLWRMWQPFPEYVPDMRQPDMKAYRTGSITASVNRQSRITSLPQRRGVAIPYD